MEIDQATAPEHLVLHETDRPADGWDDERGCLVWRTLFPAGSAPMDGLVTGVAEFGADGFLALHRHEQAETYYVLSGEGLVSLDGTEHRVAQGTSIFIPGSIEHGIRNSGTEPLHIFYALAADAFADVEYVFS